MIVFDGDGPGGEAVLQHGGQALGHGGTGLAGAYDVDMRILAQIVDLIRHGQEIALPDDGVLHRRHRVHCGNAGVKNEPGFHSQLLCGTCHGSSAKKTCSMVVSVCNRSCALAC